MDLVFTLPSCCVLMSGSLTPWTVITCPLTSAGCIFCGAQWKMKRWVFLFKKQKRNFPGDSVVKTLCFHCGRYGFDLWSGNWDPAYCKVQPENRKKGKAFPFCFCGPSLDLSWCFYLLIDVALHRAWGHLRPGCDPVPQLNRWPLCGMSFTPRLGRLEN